MLKVGMDISQTAFTGGVVTYTNQLSQKLSKLPDLEMVFFYSSLRKPYKGPLRKIKKFSLPPTFFEMLFNKWRNVGIEKFIGAVDVFHSSDWIQPPSKAKKVTTYHDVIPIKYPNWSHPKIVQVHKTRLKLVEKEIDMVIAVSESTKKDLMEVSSIPSDKIKVIYEAPSSDFKRVSGDKVSKFREKYKLPEKFVLAIGGVGERRNLKRIKDACGYPLVISGITLPWLKEEEMELLYNSATVLLYCSLYEGFGLPILEAFACGLPVITSNVSSMPEIGGNAAEYVNPFEVDDIKSKLKMVMEDEGLRKEMVKKGLVQVKKFSWEKAALETLEVYKKVMQK